MRTTHIVGLLTLIGFSIAGCNTEAGAPSPSLDARVESDQGPTVMGDALDGHDDQDAVSEPLPSLQGDRKVTLTAAKLPYDRNTTQ